SPRPCMGYRHAGNASAEARAGSDGLRPHRTCTGGCVVKWLVQPFSFKGRVGRLSYLAGSVAVLSAPALAVIIFYATVHSLGRIDLGVIVAPATMLEHH